MTDLPKALYDIHSELLGFRMLQVILRRMRRSVRIQFCDVHSLSAGIREELQDANQPEYEIDLVFECRTSGPVSKSCGILMLLKILLQRASDRWATTPLPLTGRMVSVRQVSISKPYFKLQQRDAVTEYHWSRFSQISHVTQCQMLVSCR